MKQKERRRPNIYDPRNEISVLLNSISDIKKVVSTWPKDYERVPLVCYLVTDNSGGIYTEEGESTSRVQVSLHIFAKTLTEAHGIAESINTKMSELSWMRMGYTHSSEKYEHIILMYMSEVDVETEVHFLT